MANIFRILRKFSDNFFDGLKKGSADRIIRESMEEAERRETIEEREKKIREEEELERILGSMPEVKSTSDTATTEQIMELLINYVESDGESKAPTIDDFIDLNRNENLNIRIRTLSDTTGRGFISDYRKALLNAGAEELKTPADIERVINNFIEPDDEEKLNNAKGNRNLEIVVEYIHNNFTTLSRYFIPAAKFAAINQSISTSLIQQTFKIGYSRAVEVMEQLESAGVISKNPKDSKYCIHLERREDIEAILLILENEDIGKESKSETEEKLMDFEKILNEKFRMGD